MIPFTQYLMPYGHTRTAGFDADPETEAAAKKLIKVGYRFTAEILSTNEVSFTCESVKPDADGEIDLLAIELCANGPEVDEAMRKMVKEAHYQFIEARRKEVT
jgi:hypothetical protein